MPILQVGPYKRTPGTDSLRLAALSVSGLRPSAQRADRDTVPSAVSQGGGLPGRALAAPLQALVERVVGRGFVLTQESVRLWEALFAPLLPERMHKPRYGPGSRRWRGDETLLQVHGKWLSLYRALDHKGTLLDARLRETRDLAAVRAFCRSVRLITKHSPLHLLSERHGSCPGAMGLEFGPKVVHRIRP